MHWGQGVRWSLGGAILAGIGASACCFGPLILLAVGVSGAWIGNLTVLEPYRPIFIALVLLFLVLAYRQLYRAPALCDENRVCAVPAVRRRQRVIFWLVGITLLGVMVFPYLAPYLFGY